jgi:hypothetical protein
LPERIFFWPPSEGADIPSDFVGVMIWRLPDGPIHVGLIYRTPNLGAFVLHHMGHYGHQLKHDQLKRDSPTRGQLCILCNVDPIRVPAMAASFRRLYRKNGNSGLPYGFSSPDQDWFSVVGTIQDGGTKIGLCCQTFVMAAYRATDLQMVDPLTVPNRPDDAARKQALLDKWAEDIATSEPRTRAHFEAVRTQMNQPLCRPYETAGAALADSYPCDFATASQLADEIELIMIPVG